MQRGFPLVCITAQLFFRVVVATAKKPTGLLMDFSIVKVVGMGAKGNIESAPGVVAWILWAYLTVSAKIRSIDRSS